MMNKWLKKMAVLALAGAMTMGMSTVALADTAATDTNLNASTTASDTSNINLYKDYVDETAEKSSGNKSPAENFVLTIERYGLWNVGENGSGAAKYTSSDMPTFSNGAASGATNTFTIAAAADEAKSDTKSHVAVTVPTYEAVGDYWYKVTETNNGVAGVIYGTNDGETEDLTKANGNHDQVYYIHVQVTNGATKGTYVRTVTLHQTAPGSDVNTNAKYETWYATSGTQTTESMKKVTDIQNKYYAGELNITKTVTGNAGDKNEMFKVTVVFKNESDGVMNSDITYKNFYASSTATAPTTAATSINWTTDTAVNGTKTVDFWVQDGTTVTFDNIPYGVTYTVTETQPSDDKYTHTFAFTDGDAAMTFDAKSYAADAVTAEAASGTDAEKWAAAKATGAIVDSTTNLTTKDTDTVTITNTKTSTIDVGVILKNAPYVALLILAAGMMVIYISRRRKMFEE